MSAVSKSYNPLTREQWYKLPFFFRQRWWRETEFDRKPPSAALLKEALELIAEADAIKV